MATQTLVLPEHIYTGWVGSSDGHEHLIKLIFLVIPQATSFKKKKTQQNNPKTQTQTQPIAERGISVETARLNMITFFS